MALAVVLATDPACSCSTSRRPSSTDATPSGCARCSTRCPSPSSSRPTTSTSPQPPTAPSSSTRDAIVFDGDPAAAVEHYLATGRRAVSEPGLFTAHVPGTSVVHRMPLWAKLAGVLAVGRPAVVRYVGVAPCARHGRARRGRRGDPTAGTPPPALDAGPAARPRPPAGLPVVVPRPGVCRPRRPRHRQRVRRGRDPHRHDAGHRPARRRGARGAAAPPRRRPRGRGTDPRRRRAFGALGGRVVLERARVGPRPRPRPQPAGRGRADGRARRGVRPLHGRGAGGPGPHRPR